MALKRKRTSSSMGTTYQVFLSFRGPDTRQGFADFLYHALIDAGIHVFRDDEEIRKGEYIGDEILGAIGESRIFVPIFSRGYASSKWCLIELSKMFESTEASPESGKKILPVFYDVSVDDVKRKTELYVEALLKHGEKFTPDTVQQWEEALRTAGKIKGYEVKDTGHGEFIKMLVREISMKLKVKHKYVTEPLVQRADQVKALMELLDIKAPGVLSVGIHGMGGIGKTTLARIVFNRLCNVYECCSYLADVRESGRQHKGIEHLQKQLLSDLGLRSESIMDVSDGIKQLKQNFLQKKVLIVLDDVDHKKQIQNLVGDPSWFGSGSRIIITTRNKGVIGKGVRPFEVVEMENEEALKLFSMHAFAEESPPNDYLSLSKDAVESTGRLPLALEVIGSHLRDKPIKDWTKTIKRLKKVPHKDVQEKLMISYRALDHGTKQIFLDIACFFIGHDKTLPLYMWEGCNFDAKMELKVLNNMSLVKIDVKKELEYPNMKLKRLWMHDQLRDLGREIVRAESFEKGVKSNRMWTHEDAFEVLQEEEGKKDVEMLNLWKDPTEFYQYHFGEEVFSGFRKLRYLKCCQARITGDWSRLLPELRWLSCVGCFVDMDFRCSSLKKLIVLNLSHCNISEDWSGWSQIRVGNKLKVLDLSYTNLRRTPDLSKFPNLERLILVGCIHLVEIDPSIGKLKGLKFLNVSGCFSLRSFPDELCSLNNLEVIWRYNDQVEALMKLLDIEASGVRFFGIHGMGGTGKTTLAKVVFNKVCDRYESSCFLANVRESCRQHRGIENLQERLLSDLGLRSAGIMGVSDGIVRMKEILHQKKVLIVLDDVDDKEQIDKLARDASWFCPGSRIIITTRNKQALKKELENLEVAAMEPKEALRLFSMHAFYEDSPPEEYVELSEEAVASIGRLPLALEVIGSHLRDMPRKDWAKTIKRLKKVPHEKVQNKLRISYEALDYRTKQIFLDIACFFIGHEKTCPMYMWDACEFDAKMGLRELIHKSFVKIVVETDFFESVPRKAKKLWMHNQLRDLGREIVRAESRKNGVTCNRLWMHGDAVEVLKEEEDKKKCRDASSLQS